MKPGKVNVTDFQNSSLPVKLNKTFCFFFKWRTRHYVKKYICFIFC